MDIYLDLPEGVDKARLSELAKEINESLDRSIARLDETLSVLERSKHEASA